MDSKVHAIFTTKKLVSWLMNNWEIDYTYDFGSCI
jgi:hypothetical protein